MRNGWMGLVLVLAGCGGATAFAVSAPAPPDALSCALAVAVEAGYEPVEGGLADGFVRLVRHRSMTGSDVGKEAASRVMTFGIMGATRTEWDVLRVVGAGGRLDMRAWGMDEGDKSTDPTEDAVADVEAIMERCAP